MAHLLGAKDLSVEFPTQTVLDSVTVGLSDGDRIGIVGRNGEGKSTLIRALASRQKPDSGEVIGQKSLRVGLLDQSDTIPLGHTVKYAVVGDRPEHEWAGDPRVRDVITGLLSDVPWGAVVGDLSGGQSRRVSLAALLVGEWDVLISMSHKPPRCTRGFLARETRGNPLAAQYRSSRRGHARSVVS